MTAPRFAFVLGVLALVAGGLGFVPAVTPPAAFDAPVVSLAQHYGMLCGIFPVNVVTLIFAIVFGVWGIIAALRFPWAVTYCRTLMWVSLAGLLLGLLPITNTFFGIAPLYGNDLLLHLVLVIVTAFAGYGRASRLATP